MANKWDERKKGMEDEYFVKKERELLEKMKARQETEKKEDLKATCYMRCPKCGDELKERSVTNMVVDQCAGCGGVWLDPGKFEEAAGKEQAGWLGKLRQKLG